MHAEDTDTALAADLNDGAACRAFFDREGYLLLRAAVPVAACRAASEAFVREVRPDGRALFLRHASGRYERHVYTACGHMQYPVMNVQDLPARRYGRFRDAALDLLTGAGLQAALENLLGEPAQLVHSMVFDANQATWAHRDGHYLDADKPGGMIGAWVAAETIHPDSGRFFVLPRSHRLPVPGEAVPDPNGAAYKAAMAAFVLDGPVRLAAPRMAEGDVLLWNAMTVHGSLPTVDARYSRRSFTGHYIGRSQLLRRHLASRGHGGFAQVNGMPVLLHIDQRRWRARLLQLLRYDVPACYQLLRRVRHPIG